MTETVSQRNAALVRRARCYQCTDDAGEHVLVDLALEIVSGEKWFVCPNCDRQWRIVSDELIIERLPLAEFAEHIDNGKLRVGDHVHSDAIILESGDRMPIADGDTWPVPVGARYAEHQWATS